MTISRRKEFPVLIVGAGPTGLTLAAALARYGVPVRIIEKKAHLSRTTKATNIMQRNQEVLSALGLLEPLRARSGVCRRMMVDGYGKTFGPRTLHLNETPFHDVLLCGQHTYEAVLADGISTWGVDVAFGTTLTKLVQTPTGVVATLEAGGVQEELQCAYVVGCDGPTGVTRTFTRHDFTPQKTGVAIRQVDCVLTWKRLSTADQFWMFYFPHGFAVVVPLPGGVHRILTIEPKDAIPARTPTLDELQAKMRVVTRDASVTLRDPDWFSYTDLSMGIAPGLRDGRVILAGDAGNPILPNGGQGMNTGIGDAFNLGWKLASVLCDGAPDALLDSYAHERHTLRTSLQNVQDKSLRYTTLVTPAWMRALIRGLGEPLLNHGGEYAMARAFSELAVHTRKSALTLEAMGKKGLRAGDRVRDAAVVQGTETTSLYTILYAGGWTLLAFTGTSASSSGASIVDALRSLGRDDLSCYIVSTASALTAPLPVLYDLDQIAHRAYGVTKPTLYLVRPDGHVAVRVAPPSVGRLVDYAATWIPRHALTRPTRAPRSLATVS